MLLMSDTVARRYRDFAAAEDAVQEAMLAAAMKWPREGRPDDPRAWLAQVAFRRMTDHIRSESARRRRESEAALEEAHTQGWNSLEIGRAPSAISERRPARPQILRSATTF